MSDQPFQATASGLKYRILREGDGTTKPNNASTVTVHYKGWLPEGTDGSTGSEFDSSYKRGEPISFPLSGVIIGWTEGLQLVSKGGAIELEIPPELGYGARGAGDAIPPNAMLRFMVELLEVS
jgi:FKBP-type peptidyl-prolyl cis-trans isomerase